jgi:hypothetical protein
MEGSYETSALDLRSRSALGNDFLGQRGECRIREDSASASTPEQHVTQSSSLWNGLDAGLLWVARRPVCLGTRHMGKAAIPRGNVGCPQMALRAWWLCICRGTLAQGITQIGTKSRQSPSDSPE